MHAQERRAWLFPPVAGWSDGIDLGMLDPSVEGDRQVLILAEHPDLAAGLGVGPESNVDEPNPRLHLAVHEVVATQIWNDDPPETWATAQRLLDGGYERHEVLHMLGSAVAEQILLALDLEATFDHGRFVAGLDALPASWEAQREDVLDRLDDLDDLDEPAMTWPRPGTTFTHRLTQAEVGGQVLAWGTDLEPLGPWLDDCGHVHLTADRVAEPEFDDELGQVLAGPDGWLDGFVAEDLVGLRVTNDNEIQLVEVTATAAPDDVGERLRHAFDAESHGDGLPLTVAELAHAVTADPTLPALVLPPVSDVLDACGFEVRFGHAAPAGTDWDAFARAQVVAVVALAHGLAAMDARALVMVAELYRRFREDDEVLADDEVVRRGVAKVLADPDIGPAFVALATGLSDDDDDLARFVRGIAAGVRRRDRAGLVWIEAGVATRQGEHERAEALLREALDIDPEHAPAIEEAAWYANDRGDARRAVELLGRLDDDADADMWVEAIQPYAMASSPPSARRNNPCPCGSGRKFKFCCLGADRTLPLSDRVGWVWMKLEWFVMRSGWEVEADEVLMALNTDEPEDGDLAMSLVLFHDGGVDDFLLRRGPVLPDDERNLVAQWALVERSVHEVVEVTPTVGLVLRDVRTGDLAQVRERRASARLAVGDLLFAHVVPDGQTHQMVGGVMSVPLRLRDPLLAVLDDDEADAVEVAGVLARAFAPPELRNTEGEPTVLHEVRYRVGDLEALDALDAVLDRDGDRQWSESVEADGRTWIRGMVAIDGDELVVSANSDIRIARLRHVIEQAVTGLELASASARTPDEVMADTDTTPSALPPSGPNLPPGAADALTSFILEQEERWVDSRFPPWAG